MTSRQSIDAEWLEYQYFPWSWSSLTEILGNWSQKSASFLERATLERDIQYGAFEKERLDILRPGQENAPVLIFIHGGYWQWLDKDHYAFALEPLMSAGALVATLNYTLCPEISLEAQIDQVRAACAWVWRHAHEYGGNPELLHVAGHSAGGHLAAMIATTNWPEFEAGLPRNLIKSVIMVSGLFDLEPLLSVSVNNGIGLNSETAKRNSPNFMRPFTAMPISVVVGGEETQEFLRQSQSFFNTWRSEVDSCEYIEVPGDDHFAVIERMIASNNVVTATILRHLGLAAQSYSLS
jgi:arylformamidase